jgi:hypothetical protein
MGIIKSRKLMVFKLSQLFTNLLIDLSPVYKTMNE